MRSSTRVVPAVMVLVAGAAAALGDFTFQPLCNSNWYGECSTTQCAGGGYNTFNNWGFSNCSGSLPTPGAGAIVHIGSNIIYQNGDVGVASIDMGPGATFYLRSNTTVTGQFTNTATVVMDGGNLGLTGTFVNSGTWADTSGYTRGFSNATLTNNSGAVLNLQSSNFSNGNGSGGLVTNNGTLSKTTGGNAYSNVPTVNNAAFNISDGLAQFQSSSFTSAPGATYSIAAPGTLQFVSETMAGTFNGSSLGAFRITGDTSQSANVTLNISGNGVQFQGGNMDTGTYTLTNSGIVSNIAGNAGYSGRLVNSGTYYETNGYSRSFNNFTVTNTGTVEWQAANWGVGAGLTGQYTTSGTSRKTTGGAAYMAIPISNTGPFVLQEGLTQVYNSSISSSGGASYTVSAPATLLFSDETITGTFTGVNAGLVRAQGTTTLSGNTTMNFSGNGWEWNGGALNAAGFTLTNLGRWTWNSGNAALSGTFINANTGTFTETNGYNRQFNSATFSNNGAMTWQSLNWSPGTGTNLFTNNGSITKNTGGTAYLYVPFVNNASLSTQEGGTNIYNTVQSAATASYPVAANASLVFSGATLRGTFNGVNSGSTRLENGTTLSAAATTNFTGNGLTWAGGDIDTAGFTLSNTGVMTWVPGNASIRGVLTNASGATLTDTNGYSRQFNGFVLTNTGTVNWQSANWNPGSGTNLLTNNAAIVKSTGGAAYISVPFVNNGSLSVQEGSVHVYTTLQSAAAASYPIAAGAEFRFVNPTVQGTFNSVSNGNAHFEGINLSGNTTMNFSNNGLTWNGGNIATGAFTLTNAGRMTWVPGNAGMTGRLTNTGTLIDTNGYSRQFDGFTLTSSGNVEWQSANWNRSANGGTFTNSGTVTKTTGGAAYMDVPVANTGLINVTEGNVVFSAGLTQTGAAAVTRVNGGTISSGTIALQGGRLEGNGAVGASVNNIGGVIAPGLPVGNLTLSTPPTLGAGSTFEVTLAGTTPALYDHLQVQGNVALAGTLRVVYNGTFNPIQGTSFRVLDASGTRTGTFSNIVYVNRPYSSSVVAQYDDHGVTLTITQRCGSADFNGDGDIGTDQDIEAFFRCLAGNCCETCEGADFNFDGDIGTDQDIEAFFRVLAGSAC